jgi:hypothetical protein
VVNVDVLCHGYAGLRLQAADAAYPAARQARLFVHEYTI